jgi:hypothetical protein
MAFVLILITSDVVTWQMAGCVVATHRESFLRPCYGSPSFLLTPASTMGPGLLLTEENTTHIIRYTNS